MGLATPGNNFLFGIAKQTNETTIPTTEEYAVPVYSGRAQPLQTMDRIQVTDAAAITGDPFKHGDIHWEADVVFPGFAASLGRFLSAFWPTDTKTGAGPYTHTFSGLGTAGPWVTCYNIDLTGGAVEETFEAGRISEISFSSDENGGPLKVGFKATGKKPTIATYTNATPEALTGGYFTATGAVIKFEVDNATPVAVTNVQSFALTVSQAINALATVDSQSVGVLGAGKVEFALAMTLLFSSQQEMDAYRATYYGAAAGSTPSSTIVPGSVELNFVHTGTGTWSFKLVVPKVAMIASAMQPDAGGAPLTMAIAAEIMKPAAGDHVQPVLINAVATTY